MSDAIRHLPNDFLDGSLCGLTGHLTVSLNRITCRECLTREAELVVKMHENLDAPIPTRSRPGLPPLNKDRFDVMVVNAMQGQDLSFAQRMAIGPGISQHLWNALKDYGVVS